MSYSFWKWSALALLVVAAASIQSYRHEYKANIHTTVRTQLIEKIVETYFSCINTAPSDTAAIQCGEEFYNRVSMHKVDFGW